MGFFFLFCAIDTKRLHGPIENRCLAYVLDNSLGYDNLEDGTSLYTGAKLALHHTIGLIGTRAALGLLLSILNDAHYCVDSAAVTVVATPGVLFVGLMSWTWRPDAMTQ
jgi:hypothetical protein